MGQMISLQFLCLNIPYAVSPVLIAYIARQWFGRSGDLGLIPAIEVVLIGCSIVYMVFLALWTLRVGRFARLRPQGAT
jgi:hypothetical protein